MSAPRQPQWHPAMSRSERRPAVGQLIAYEHAVWRVITVEDLEPSEANDMAVLRVHVEHVGGAREGARTAWLTAYGPSWWSVYQSGRWPMCSCCGEPMPCRTVLTNETVAANAAWLDAVTSRLPGCCWACGEPIGTRQQSVTYRGENLDLPGGAPVRFHTRSRCWGAATAYELRWIAADPRNERILTWPECPGTLIVHADGTSECLGGLQDCRGHETHDHAAHCSCTEHGSMVEVAKALGLPTAAATAATAYTCPRGCDKDRHPGCAPGPRRRRDQPPLPADDRSAA